MAKTLKARISADATKFTSEMKRVRSTVATTASYVSAAMVAGVAYGMKKAAEEAMTFDQAMREINTLLQISEKDFDILSKQLVNFSVEMGVKLPDATRGFYEAISRGIPKDNALNFMTIASKSAIGGLATVEDSVVTLTGIMNAFGKTTMKDTQHIADLMFKTVEIGGTRFVELAQSIGLVTPIAANLGVSLEDLFASYAALTKQGMRTEQATTAIKQAMNSLLGNAEGLAPLLDKIATKYGKANWQGVGFIKTIQELSKAKGGNVKAIKELIPNIRGLLGVLGLSGKAMETVTKAQEAMANAAGAQQKAFDEMEKATSRDMAKLIESFRSVGIEVGNELLPLISESAKELIAVIHEMIASGELKKWGKEASDAIKAIIPTLVWLINFVTKNAKGLMFLGFGMKGIDLIFKASLAIKTVSKGLAAMQQQQIWGKQAEGISLVTKNAKLLSVALKGIGEIAAAIGIAIAGWKIGKALGEKLELAEKIFVASGGRNLEDPYAIDARVLDNRAKIKDQQKEDIAKEETLKKQEEIDGVIDERLNKLKELSKNFDKELANKKKELISKKLDKELANKKKAQSLTDQYIKALNETRKEQFKIAKEKRKELMELAKENQLQKPIAKKQKELDKVKKEQKKAEENQKLADKNLEKVQAKFGAKTSLELSQMTSKERRQFKRDSDKKEKDAKKHDDKMRLLDKKDLLGRTHISRKGKEELELWRAQQIANAAKAKAGGLDAKAKKLEKELIDLRKRAEQALELWKIAQRKKESDMYIRKLKLRHDDLIARLKNLRLKVNTRGFGNLNFAGIQGKDYTRYLAETNDQLSEMNRNKITVWESITE